MVYSFNESTKERDTDSDPTVPSKPSLSTQKTAINNRHSVIGMTTTEGTLKMREITNTPSTEPPNTENVMTTTPVEPIAKQYLSIDCSQQNCYSIRFPKCE